jgi:hypothetical protein
VFRDGTILAGPASPLVVVASLRGLFFVVVGWWKRQNNENKTPVQRLPKSALPKSALPMRT